MGPEAQMDRPFGRVINMSLTEEACYNDLS